MSETPQPFDETQQRTQETFALNSNWAADVIATGLEEGTIDSVEDRGGIDLLLRNPAVLADRAANTPGEIGGSLNDDQADRLKELNDTAAEILVLAGKDPAEWGENQLMGLPILASNKGITPPLVPFVAQTIRDGNALVAEVATSGKLNPSLLSYFNGNITAVSGSLTRAINEGR